MGREMGYVCRTGGHECVEWVVAPSKRIVFSIIHNRGGFSHFWALFGVAFYRLLPVADRWEFGALWRTTTTWDGVVQGLVLQWVAACEGDRWVRV